MNPYEVLRVPTDAALHQIKTAYRQRAKQTHPDTGADGAEFASVAKAYAVLSDPEMRKRYDETGSTEDGPAPLTVHQRMIQIIAGMFGEALEVEAQNGTSLKHFDLITAMRQNIERNLALVTKNRDRFRKGTADRQFLLKRITRKDDGANLFADMIRDQLKQFEPLLKQAELDVLAMQMAADEIRHYKSEVELVQAIQMMQYGGSYGAQSTTGTSIFRW